MEFDLAKIIPLKCPNCGANLNRGQMKCQHCGAELILLPDESAFKFRSEIVCPKCGSLNEKSSWFCQGCNTVLTKDIEMLREMKKKIVFEQNKIRAMLPSLVVGELEAEEFIYYLSGERSTFYYLVTDERIIKWNDVFQRAKLADVTSIGNVQFDISRGMEYFEVGTFQGRILIEISMRGPVNIHYLHTWVVKAMENHNHRKKDVRALILSLSLDEDVGHKEIREKTETIYALTCHKCGKEIPKGNYAFCPFCGTGLKDQ